MSGYGWGTVLYESASLDALAIELRRGPCPDSLPGSRRVLRWLSVGENSLLVRYPNQWSLLVEDGCRATLQWPESSEVPTWIVDSWVVPFAMQQRGILCLHATAMDVNGRTIAIAGDSGAGKSTTAMALRQRGHSVLVDDVTLLDQSGDKPVFIPFRRRLHLLRDAADAVGVDFDEHTPLVAFPEKVGVSLDEFDDRSDRVLNALVVLESRDDVSDLVVNHPTGGQAVAVVQVLAGRQTTGPAILGPTRYFELLTHLCKSTTVVHIQRPKHSSTLDDVVAIVEGV